jgi:hypothetical protein
MGRFGYRLIDPSQQAFAKRASCATNIPRIGASHMMDILMLALGFGLFAAGIGYAYACERL